MSKKEGTTQISAQVECDFREEIYEYCRVNNISVSNLIRRCLIREIQAGTDFHLLRECEKLIDQKIDERLKVINISARKVN